MNGSLLSWYLNLNALLAFAYVLWLATKTLSRWPALRLNGNTQLSWARRLFLCAVAASTLIAIAPQWTSLVPWAQTLKAGIIGEWTAIAGAPAAAPQAVDTGLPLRHWLAAALFAGWMFQLTRLLMQFRKLKHLVAQSTPWKQMPNIRLLVSSAIAVPFATKALGKCTVVLPEQLLTNPQHWRLAALHELQHARNGDLDWLLMLETLKVVCFWNPCIHLWMREFEVLHELACDESLITNRKVNAETYGNCLLDVAQYQSMPVLPGMSSMVPLRRWFDNRNTLLRRRIMKLGNVRNERNSKIKSLFYGALIMGTLSAGSLLIAADAPEGANTPTLIPVVRVNPEYPVQALAEGAEGWVQLSFSIDQQGGVYDAKVVQSCAGPKDEPCVLNVPTFADTALNALRQWKYTPPKEGEKSTGLQTILRFKLAK